ncbi:MAG: hypothetical protein FWC00_01050 [Firmicutes bacterium]|nr:hypothetical protein [Bacillota bacterium]
MSSINLFPRRDAIPTNEQLRAELRKKDENRTLLVPKSIFPANQLGVDGEEHGFDAKAWLESLGWKYEPEVDLDLFNNGTMTEDQINWFFDQVTMAEGWVATRGYGDSIIIHDEYDRDRASVLTEKWADRRNLHLMSRLGQTFIKNGQLVTFGFAESKYTSNPRQLYTAGSLSLGKPEYNEKVEEYIARTKKFGHIYFPNHEDVTQYWCEDYLLDKINALPSIEEINKEVGPTIE